MIIVLKILIAASFSFSIHSTDIPPYLLASWETCRHVTLASIFSSLAGGQFEPKSSGDYSSFSNCFDMLLLLGSFNYSETATM